MKSTCARRPARLTLGPTRPWITAAAATAQWKARFVRRYPPPLEPPPANRALLLILRRHDPRPLDPPGQSETSSLRSAEADAWPTSNRSPGRLQIGIGGRLPIGMHGRLRRNPHMAEALTGQVDHTGSFIRIVIVCEEWVAMRVRFAKGIVFHLHLSVARAPLRRSLGNRIGEGQG
jgi:hypothetical protein